MSLVTYHNTGINIKPKNISVIFVLIYFGGRAQPAPVTSICETFLDIIGGRDVTESGTTQYCVVPDSVTSRPPIISRNVSQIDVTGAGCARPPK